MFGFDFANASLPSVTTREKKKKIQISPGEIFLITLPVVSRLHDILGDGQKKGSVKEKVSHCSYKRSTTRMAAGLRFPGKHWNLFRGCLCVSYYYCLPATQSH